MRQAAVLCFRRESKKCQKLSGSVKVPGRCCAMLWRPGIYIGNVSRLTSRYIFREYSGLASRYIFRADVPIYIPGRPGCSRLIVYSGKNRAEIFPALYREFPEYISGPGRQNAPEDPYLFSDDKLCLFLKLPPLAFERRLESAQKSPEAYTCPGALLSNFLFDVVRSSGRQNGSRIHNRRFFAAASYSST